MNEPMELNRRGEPGMLDTAPKGSKCIVTNDGKIEIYVQISDDENSPIWQKQIPDIE